MSELLARAKTTIKVSLGGSHLDIIVPKDKCIAEAIKMYFPELFGNSGWISVDEKRPEAGRNNLILVVTKKSGVRVGYDCGFKHAAVSIEGFGERHYTHWMPLPEPPKP